MFDETVNESDVISCKSIFKKAVVTAVTYIWKKINLVVAVKRLIITFVSISLRD